MMDSSEIKIFNFERICRLCLNERRILIEIFESSADNNNLTIDQKIKACATVDLFRGDGLPPRICVKCLSNVNAAFEFKIQCENADKTLHDVQNLFLASEISTEAKDKFEEDDHQEIRRRKNEKITKDFNRILVIKKQEIESLETEELDSCKSNLEEDEESGKKIFEDNFFYCNEEQIAEGNPSDAPSFLNEGLKGEWETPNRTPLVVPADLQKPLEAVAVAPANREGIGVGNPRANDKKKTAGDPTRSPCPFCNKMLTRVDEHVRLLHRNRVYVCTKRECGAEFSTLKNLQSHQLRCYDVEKAYKCPKCFKQFHRKSNYKAHVKRHADKKDFQCQLCERAFVDTTGLRRHFLKHHEPEQEIFISGCCGKRFKSKEGLKKHIRNGICGFQIFHDEEFEDSTAKENGS